MRRLTSENYGIFKSLDELEAIGHRVVHGGEKFKESVVITDEVIQEIKIMKNWHHYIIHLLY